MNTIEVGRLAMRVEGDYWVAYYAKPETMEGATLLGSIAMHAVTNNDNRKHMFIEMMKGIVSDLILETAGVAPTWTEPETAPEHERSGSA